MTRKRSILAATAWAAMWLAVASAGFAGEKARDKLLPDEFEAGYSYMYFQYKEPGLMKETGSMNGVFARYTHHFPRGMMVRLDGEVLYGDLEYDGQYSDGTPVTGDTKDWLVGGRILAGKDFVLDEETRWALTPFIGFGARYWNDDIQMTGGYEREITQLYSPAGLELTNRFADNWRWGARGEYDFFWRGWVKSHLGEIQGLSDVEVDQKTGSGYGLRAALFLKYDRESVSFVLEPFYRYWRVADSESGEVRTAAGAASVLEPKNRTHIYGFRLAAR